MGDDLDLSDAEYSAAFRLFKAACKEPDLLAPWFERSTVELISGSESLDILSVGGADGELDMRRTVERIWERPL